MQKTPLTDGKTARLRGGKSPFMKQQATTSNPKQQPKSEAVWLTTNEVALLLGITERAIQKSCKSKRFRVKIIRGNRSRSGKSYLIELTSLPPQAQSAFRRQGITAKPARTEHCPPLRRLKHYPKKNAKSVLKRL